MKIPPCIFLFATLGVASARVGESANHSDQGEKRKLQEDFLEVEFSTPKISTNKIRVMVGYKNDRGKQKTIAAEASESINEFKNVNALTMIIPRARLNALANDPDIE
jgi:hypothetical protein